MRDDISLGEEKTCSLFLRLVGDFLVGRIEEYGDCSHELDELLHLAHIHSLDAMVYYMLKAQRENLRTQRPELVQRMQKAYHSAVYMAVTQESSMAEMQQKFSQARIPLVFFKGAQLKELYPVPELRTMGDLDCLIRREDRERAHKLMCTLGYQCEIDSEPVWLYRRESIVIEMHTLLAANDIGNGVDYASFFSEAMEHVVRKDGQFYLELEYHVCYLIYHIAKHLCSTGAGVRMIADIAVVLHGCCDEVDWKKLRYFLEVSHLYETALAVFGLCHRWFGIEAPVPYRGSEQVLDDLENYIVAGGTFGFETHDIGDVYRRNTLRREIGKQAFGYRLRLVKDYFFPPRAYLVKYFPLSEKYKWMWPIAWVCRCWTGVFHRKKHSLATMRSMTGGDVERSYREVRMLREIGL